MQFTTPLLALLASTSFAAVIPRSALGSWSINVSQAWAANGWNKETVTAVYTSDAYPEGITSTCEYEDLPSRNPSVIKGCDNEAFEYDLNLKTIKVKQNVDLPNPQTVFGEADITLQIGLAGRSAEGSVVVEATAATA